MLIFGGESSEHSVSVISAQNVLAALDTNKFSIDLVYIDKSGKWWLTDSVSSGINLDGSFQIVPVLGGRSFVELGGNQLFEPDVILPILHGKNGEDGAVQALAALMHLPIVGCDMTAGAICMDKVATKRIARDGGVPVVDFAVHHVGDPTPDYVGLSAKLGPNLFVKPSRSGSSVGAGRADNAVELMAALNLAHQYDDVVLIERNVRPRELEVAVLGNVPDLQVSAVGEIKPDGDFYSYDSKYDSTSKSAAVIPAEVDHAVITQIQDYARQIFTLLGCRGLSRIDFFLGQDGKLYFNEINTLPGFTNISMYPKLWLHQGMTYPQLIERLIELALKSK